MTATPAARAQRDVTLLFFAWLVLSLVGGLLIILAWPDEVIARAGTFDEQVPTETGDESLVVLGFVLSGIGQIFLAVYVVAAGVRLALRAEGRGA